MKKTLLLIASVFMAATLPSIEVSLASGWDVNNNPVHIITAAGGIMETNFEKLPTKGFLSKVPWPDTYWPNFKIGIAHRFQQTNANAPSALRTDRRGRRVRVFNGFTKQELENMTREQLNALSPAEKLDIANGDYTYPTYNREYRYHSYKDAQWQGYCHGWAPEAMEQPEPGKTDYTNKDGIVIPMTSSDIKALFTFHRANINQNKATFCGTRSKGRIDGQDINAGALRIILSNFFGIMGKGFVGDIDAGFQVWNQPFYGFEVVSQKFRNGFTRYSAYGTVREVDEVIHVYYINELVGANPEPQVGGPLSRVNENPADKSKGFIIKKTFYITTELNAAGNIIGGRYTGGSIGRNLDMVWIQDPAEFKDNYAILPQLLEDSLKK